MTNPHSFETKKKKEQSLRTEIQTLQKTLHETTKQNREEEAQLRKKKFKIEGEVENWIHKYDQDMEEKQTELEDITVSLFFAFFKVVLILMKQKKKKMKKKNTKQTGNLSRRKSPTGRTHRSSCRVAERVWEDYGGEEGAEWD